MTQTRFFLTAGKQLAERVYGALGVAFEEDGLPLAIIEVDEARDIHEVSLYAEPDDTLDARIRAVVDAFAPGIDIGRETLPDIDWVTKSLEGLQPVRAGRFLVHGSHDRDRRRAGDIAIEIEAGLAFGTGHHGTTSGCLEMIGAVATRERPRNALDLGAGSAVLAIALAKLLPIDVLATDIDPVATGVGAANARLNEVASRVTARTATGFHDPIFRARGPFDLIVANILARPLMRLAPEMAHYVTAGGSVILSGILDRQRRSVLAAYATQSFRHVRSLHREGWVTLHLKR